MPTLVMSGVEHGRNMVEKARRTRVGDEPRGGESREWEVFVREDCADPLQHVGSVTAPSAEVANEQASRLFAWYAEDLWLCPADELRRYSTHSLGEDAGADPELSDRDDNCGNEPRTREL